MKTAAGTIAPPGENRSNFQLIAQSGGFGEILGQSPAMQHVFDAIRRLAATDIDVVIIGETDTGKDLVARAIHYFSRRGHKRFEPINCAAIPLDLVENQLFGHERGAFTGAQMKSVGLIEHADGGTLFLDGINQLPLAAQCKLLRVVQERRVRRLGARDEIAVDFRGIAASSADLKTEVTCGRFRADLYFRISVGLIVLPPLRERKEDIPLLAQHFCSRYAREMHKDPKSISPRKRKSDLSVWVEFLCLDRNL